MRLQRPGPSEPNRDPSEYDDAALVAAARAGGDAFETLFRRYWDGVARYCYLELGAWQEAEDAANQIFTDAYAALWRFEDRGSSFRSWLFAIAHNEVVDRQLRRKRRPEASLDPAWPLVDPGPTPEDLAVTAAALAETRRVLVRMPDRLRQVIELRLTGLNDREIADALGIGHDAVRQAQSRAIARLRELLGVTIAGQGMPHA
jgi:RNA polymerase sigma-70 factor (ECF subfamily)